jgi:predicted acyl esterase
MTRLPVLIVASSLVAASLPAQVRTQFGVMIPMRDGVRLAADVWLPEAPGRYPVLLARTPYMKTGLGLNQWAMYFAKKGYVFVIQDTRGRGDSEGPLQLLFPGRQRRLRQHRVARQATMVQRTRRHPRPLVSGHRAVARGP